VHEAYGDHVNMFAKTVELIQDKTYFLSCLKAAHMDEAMAERIPAILKEQLQAIKN